MQKFGTYDTDVSAQLSGGIKLKASEPLSPNAFVRIPPETSSSTQTTTSIPLSRQKKMRVPRGGSVDRPAQRNPRNQSMAADRPARPFDPVGPSLHIVLENDADDVPSQEEEAHGQPESLAQFVANFPKIPSGLIFDFPEDDVPQDQTSDQHELEDDVPEEGVKTIRLDEGQMPPGETVAFPQQKRASAPRDEAAYSQEVPHSKQVLHKQTPTGARVQPVNPRFEKLIREATSTSRPVVQRASSGPIPPRSAHLGISRMQNQTAKAPYAWSRIQGQQSPSRSVAPPVFGYAANTSRSSGLRSHPSGPISRSSATSGPVAAHPIKQVPAATAFASRVPSVASPVMPLTSSSVPASQASDAKPLLDAAAIEESTMFDEPPISIADGMKDADKSRKKGRKVLIGVLVAIIIALVGFMAFMSTRGSITIPEISITTKDISNSSNNASSTSSNSSGPTQENVAGTDAPAASGAGAVTYRYTAKTPAGIEYTVEESTTFDEAGNCTFTTMKMQFPNEQAAKDFTDNLARDLGSKFTLDSLNGANATVTVDNSALGLDREDYENALRFSVDDLVILKK